MQAGERPSNQCREATRRRSISPHDRLNVADAIAIHNLQNMTIAMSAIFELIKCITVSILRFTSDLQLPLCIIWIVVIIIYSLRWTFQRTGVTSSPPNPHPPQLREPLSEVVELDLRRNEELTTFVAAMKEAAKWHLCVMRTEKERQTNWTATQEEQVFSTLIRVFHRVFQPPGSYPVQIVEYFEGDCVSLPDWRAELS
ncbi:hypothetical protein ECG_00176 [Echinococcus granulosus]|nr:hypothetical protein ECG_00176 [Echinococcus granulosus]